METKQWYESKMVWLGVIETLVAVLNFFAEWYQSGNYSIPSIALFAAGLLTIILRVWFTSGPIAH